MTLIENLGAASFWLALLKIIWIDLLLSGDNAVVIALASRRLPQHQQRKSILFGSMAAVGLRVVLTFFAVNLLDLPFLKLVGAALLVWIGIKLLTSEGEDPNIKSADSLWMAVRTIVIADFVMSLDNVIGVAAAAQTGPDATRFLLLIFGLGLSVPLIVFGSGLILKLMQRFPLIVTLGAALLGFVGGEMAMSDPVLQGLSWHAENFTIVAGIIAAFLVIGIGKIRSHRDKPEGPL